MRCTSPLFIVNTLGKEEAPPFIKRNVYGFDEFYHFTEHLGVNFAFFTRVNCGQCLSCRVNKAREWAERCLLEAQSFEHNYFITLTYSDDKLVYSDCGLPTLSKRDVQLFLKRLRKWYFKTYGEKLRYFLTGEYGEKLHRPHYHCIFFNLRIDDLVTYKTVKRANDVYIYCNSPTIEKIWGNGFAVISKVVPETCAYTAQYSLKKVGMRLSESYARMILDDVTKTDDERFNALCALKFIQPPFQLQSNKPGIGGDFCQKNLDEILVSDSIPGCKIKNIRYFDKLLERSNPLRLSELKELRISNIDSSKVKIYDEAQQFIINDRIARKLKSRKQYNFD